MVQLFEVVFRQYLKHNFMNKFIISFTFLFCLNAFGQSKAIDSRLLTRYSSSELKSMQKNQPNEYRFLLAALDKGVYISDIPTEKEKGIVWDGVLKIDPNGTYTFISLNKEIMDRYQRYKIEGSNKMLTILPRIVIENQINK
jgi:hypothetical protein